MPNEGKNNKFLTQTRENLIKMYIEALKEDEIPWRKSWSATPPMNALSNTIYRGINKAYLNFASIELQSGDPRWCTFKQAKEKGWSIKKGEHGYPIEYWMYYDKINKKFISIQDYNKFPDEEKPDVVLRAKKFTVFNGKQIDGIPPYDQNLNKDNIPPSSMFVENLIKNLGVGYKEGGTRAFYSPLEDYVCIPPAELFSKSEFSEYDYNSVRLHELCHSTGHKSRLNRDLINLFGSEEYAREELRAEISSSFISQSIGLPVSDCNLENHKAYIQSWISVLEKNPNELFQAIKEAEKIESYVLEKGYDKLQEYIKEHVDYGRTLIHSNKDMER